MKSRLYYAISCFLLAVVLLFLAVPLFTHRLYPKQQAIRVLHTMGKGEQLTDKDIEPITVGALHLSEGSALTKEDVIGRYAAVDLVAEDILFLSKLSQLPLEGDLPKDILPKGNAAQLMTLRMIEGSEYPIPETGDVIKINLFDKKWKDIPELQFVRILSVVPPKKAEDTVVVTVALNEKQQQYVKRQKKTVFYASVIVRSNEELAEKLLAEQESMAKHILIIGSPGSGKSVFSAALASAVGKRNRQTLLISGDSRISMLPFFCGNTDTDGLGTLYAGEITSQRTADAIKILREFPNIGVMGFQIHERKRQEGTIAQIQQLYTVVDGMAEVVIWDGTSDWTDAFQIVMTEKAEVAACLLTADVKGLLYFKQYQDKTRRLTHCLLLEGLSKPYSLHEEMNITIGGFDGILPFGREIERYVMEGNLFSILTCCHARYRETVERTLDDLLEGRIEK